MAKQRVVITGMGAVSPFGQGKECLWQGLHNGLCAVQFLPEARRDGLECAVAGIVPQLHYKYIAREFRRTMSAMSLNACLAVQEALGQAGFETACLPRMGIAVGSTLGSPQALQDFFSEYIQTGTIDAVRSTAFFKVMGHSVAANIAMTYGLRGRLLAPAAACASGLVSIGLGYESIAWGKENIMLCGGADEFHTLTLATFDRLGAASHEKSIEASRPFDKDRQGIVVSEGAGVLVLESLSSAQKRGAAIKAEIIGYDTLTAPRSMAQPDSEGMQLCMQAALTSAGIHAANIDYVNAHATATKAGDIAEGLAIEKVFCPEAVPVSSFKGALGHSLAASGALESIVCVQMLEQGIILPTAHLRKPDPACGKLQYAQQKKQTLSRIIKNSFAMGGVYSSLILQAWEG
jgi:3-oxoacyl-[acyl-carrier-protein] synthase II